MLDYKNAFKEYEEEFLKDLKELIKIPSVLDESMLGDKEMPFGKGPKDALLFMESIAKRDGFEPKIYDNMALEINYGNGEEFILAAGHLDVVPFGDGWNTNPTNLVYEKETDKLFGRGTLDDKGGSLLVYYALRIIKDKGINLNKRIKLVFGTDEESGSRCIKGYKKHVTEIPVAGFIPDSDFPLIFSEKGILRLEIAGRDEKLKESTLCAPYNMVPNKVSLTLNESINDKDTFTGSGQNAHGSTPEEGKNAVLDLVRNLKKEGFSSLLIDTINNFFTIGDADDTKGINLKINSKHKHMGELSLNLGYFKVSNGNFTFGLDIRYPKSTNQKKITKTIQNKLGDKFNVFIKAHTEKLYVSPKSKLIKTLYSIYQKHTGDYTTPIIATGGGTYAREFPNTVAFGPQYPGKESLIHAPNEYILKSDLFLAGAIYLEALVELAK